MKTWGARKHEDVQKGVRPYYLWVLVYLVMGRASGIDWDGQSAMSVSSRGFCSIITIMGVTVGDREFCTGCACAGLLIETCVLTSYSGMPLS